MVQDKKCTGCGNKLIFNPKTQRMYCEYCRSERDVIPDKKKESEEIQKELDVYTCPNCGAQIICDSTSTSTFCVYCKNTAILKDKLKGKFKPQAIIPFKTTKDEAVEAFINLRQGKKLIPDEFLHESNIEEIRGVYIPFWLFDYKVDGILDARATREDERTEDNKTIKTTYEYHVARRGAVSFDNIPIDGSTHFQDNIMRSLEPFAYADLKKYTSDYLSGFLSELYDVEEEIADDIATERARITAYNTFKQSIESQQYNTVEYINNKFDPTKLRADYVLLPVWMLNVKYKNDFYTFAMNGQTKKIVGNIPVDEEKAKKMMIKKTLINIVILLIIAIIIWKAVW